MRKKEQIYQTFSLLVIIVFLIMIISPTAPMRFIFAQISKIASPIQVSVYSNLGIKPVDESQELIKLKEENRKLLSITNKLNILQKDVEAYRTQFAQAQLPANKLLPVKIIGSNRTFGNQPTELVINAGSNQKIKKGMGVIFKDVFLGIVEKVDGERSVIRLLLHESFTHPVMTLRTGAQGILKGEKNKMILGQVVMTDKLEKGDIAVTGIMQKTANILIPANLLIGKIGDVEKKPSALFQSAEITPIIDYAELSTVFVLVENY